MKKTGKIYTFLIVLTIILIVFSDLNIYATTYYVSNSGNDLNSGRTEEQAWKTLNKVNLAFLIAGDEMLFKRGDKWTGTIKVNFSGRVGTPITFGAYGIGLNPVISGFTAITGWTNKSGNIWESTNAVSTLSTAKIVLINGVNTAMGREPETGYYLVDNHSGNTSITSSSLSGADWTGATAVIRKERYIQQRATITSHVSTTINYTDEDDIGYSPQDGWGFFIQNDSLTLDTQNEWYYNPSTKKLVIYSDSEPTNVKVSIVTNLAVCDNKNYITFKNITFEGANEIGIEADGSDYLTVQNCNIKYIGYEGINLDATCDYITVDNNLFLYCMQHAIKDVPGASFTFITNNTIDSTGMIPGCGRHYPQHGMFIYSDSCLIQFNQILNSSANGIQVKGNVTSEVRNNYIDKFCLILADFGGIYTDGAHVSCIIDGNIALNGFGNLEGTSGETSNSNGIYLDWYSTNVTISNNISAFNGGRGFFASSGAKNNKWEHNVTFDNLSSQLRLHGQATSTEGETSGNTINNNIFVAKTYSQFAAYFYSSANNIHNFFTGDSNYYARPIDDNAMFWTGQPDQYGNKENKTFSEWQSFSGQDANSKFITLKLVESETVKLFYNNTKQKIRFYLGKSVFRDIVGNNIVDTFSLLPFTSKILIGKDFKNINQRPQISDQSFHFTSPKSINDSIGQLLAFDADIGQILKFSVLQGNEMDYFFMDSISGGIFINRKITTSKDSNFELFIGVTDNSVNSLSDTARISINIKGTDLSPPEITSFSIPSRAFTLKIPIETYRVYDDLAVKGYLLTEYPEIPNSKDSIWDSSIPRYYWFSNEGTKTLYAWAKDSAGNISEPVTDTIIITLPDLSPKYSEYLFEETEGIDIIDSNDIYDGKIIYNVNRTKGVIGKGLSFTGLGYVSLGKCYGENVQNEVTLSMWIKPSSSYNEGYQGLIMHGGPDIETYALYVNQADRSIGFKTTGTSTPWLVANNLNDLWDGSWHHLAVVYNGSEKAIYMDGEVLISASAFGQIEQGFEYNLLIGAGGDDKNPSLLYHGDLDEVRIYNYALNEGEIDSLYHSINRIIKKTFVTEYVSICENENYFGWTEAGEYTRILKCLQVSSSGADSVVTTKLQVNPVFFKVQEITIKEGDNYLGWTESGNYQQNFTSSNGCDSIFITNLTVIPTFYTVVDVSICEGGSYLGLTAQGQYKNIFPSSLGGDSIVIINLWVNPVYYLTKEITIKEYENYLGWTVSGKYQQNFTSSWGCDSIVITNLTVIPTVHTVMDVTICEGGSYLGLTTQGQYKNIFPSSLGGDSIVIINLWVNPVYYITEEITINEGDNYLGWTEPGQYLQNLTSVDLCDSIILTDLKILQPSTQFIELEKGWNIFSTFLTPANLNPDHIFNDLKTNNQFIEVQDENENVYHETDKGWINKIGEVQISEGYKIRLKSSGILNIKGQPVRLPIDIQLNEGLNIISFPFEGTADAMEVINPLIDAGILEKVQDERGNSIEFWNSTIGWMNGIGDFSTGEGYLVLANRQGVLPILGEYNKSGLVMTNEKETNHFKLIYEGNGFGHMNINITGLNKLNLHTDDEIAAYDGLNCVGSVKLSETNINKNSVSINASASDGDHTNGFNEGNKIELRVWQKNSNTEFHLLSEVIKGDFYYQEHGSVFIQLLDKKEIETDFDNLLDFIIYPNPAHHMVSIEFSSLPQTETKIIFTDIIGNHILTKEVKSIVETVNINFLSSGMYIIKAVSGEHYNINKLIIK